MHNKKTARWLASRACCKCTRQSLRVRLVQLSIAQGLYMRDATSLVVDQTLCTGSLTAVLLPETRSQPHSDNRIQHTMCVFVCVLSVRTTRKPTDSQYHDMSCCILSTSLLSGATKQPQPDGDPPCPHGCEKLSLRSVFKSAETRIQTQHTRTTNTSLCSFACVSPAWFGLFSELQVVHVTMREWQSPW